MLFEPKREHLTDDHLQIIGEIIDLAVKRVEAKNPMDGIPDDTFSDADVSAWGQIVGAIRRCKEYYLKW